MDGRKMKEGRMEAKRDEWLEEIKKGREER